MRKRIKRFWSSRFIVLFFGTLVVLTVVLFIASFISEKTNPPAEKITYGVTFSPMAAQDLGLNWQNVYLQILDELKVKNLRIPSYWNVIEIEKGKYDFSETDFLVSEAQKRNAKLIITLGVKQPRWPECHLPLWARKLSEEERHKKVLELIERVVNRYKDYKSVYAWQVENEPFFYPYGDNCYPPDIEFLKQEVGLVKSLDSRPVIVSETGELAPWVVQMQLSDIFGTTLYRTVWNPVLGYTTYPLTPGFYSLRSNFFRKFFAPKNQKTIIVELQSEPWLHDNKPLNTSLNEQNKVFPIPKMKENIDFAKRTSFDEIYIWGVEWWYFMKENGQAEYWDYAKTLF